MTHLAAVHLATPMVGHVVMHGVVPHHVVMSMMLAMVVLRRRHCGTGDDNDKAETYG